MLLLLLIFFLSFLYYPIRLLIVTMSVVKIPFIIILQSILQQLSLPKATFEEQNKDGPVYTCTVRYHYEDNKGTRFDAFMLGLSHHTLDEAKDYACFAVLEHLKAIYILHIVDYNHKKLTALKNGKNPIDKLKALKASYNDLSGQYVGFVPSYT